MTALWLLIPSRVKLYGAIFVAVLLLLLRYKNKAMADAVARYAEEIEDADAKRAADIRANVRDRMRDYTGGYRDDAQSE